jgi:hypothetical protein
MVTQIQSLIVRPTSVEDDESKVSLRINVIQLQIIVSNIVQYLYLYFMSSNIFILFEDFNSNHSIYESTDGRIKVFLSLIQPQCF